MRGVIPHDARRLEAGLSEDIAQALRDVCTSQMLVGAVLFVGAIATAGVAWSAQRPVPLPAANEVFLLVLITAVAASQWLPIRIGKATHLYFASVPLYLLCCLFAPPVAMVGTGIGMLTREISICRRCGNTAGDVTAQVGRWMVVSFGVSTVVHLFAAEYILFAGALAAILLWIGDVISSPFVLTPASGREALHTMARAARSSYAGELMQYLIALFTLALLRSGVDWLGLLYIPLILMSLLLLYLYLKGMDDMRLDTLVPAAERKAS